MLNNVKTPETHVAVEREREREPSCIGETPAKLQEGAAASTPSRQYTPLRKIIKRILQKTPLGRRMLLGWRLLFLWIVRRKDGYRVSRAVKVYYHPKNPYTPTIIWMADGKLKHCGLADRFKGIHSAYAYCRERGLPFKIHYVSPYCLQDYLVPNKYDWTIDPQDISYNSRIAAHTYLGVIFPIHDVVIPEGTTYDTPADEYDRLAKRFWNLKRAQIHLYSNCAARMELFGECFHELFKSSPLLEQALRPHREALANGYISMTFRFMELLGDFKDWGHMSALPPKERQALIDHCLAAIDRIRRQHPDISRVHVTSDSITFRQAVARTYDYAYVVEGEVGHIDFHDKKTDAAIVTTLTDFFLISQARKAYSVKTPQMYGGDFARVASLINGIPFECAVI